MSIQVFPIRKDSDLVAWSANWDQRITATPAAFGLTAIQAAAYHVLHLAMTDAYARVVNPNTNSKQAVIAKNQARNNLIKGAGGAWELVKIVQAFPGTTDSMRGELGLRIADRNRTPVSAPTSQPHLSIMYAAGRAARVQLRDEQNPDRRGKPDNVLAATVLYHVGEDAPANLSEWRFGTNAARPVFDLEFPADIAPGSKVWITAFWVNRRMDPGPAAKPQSIRLGDGIAKAA